MLSSGFTPSKQLPLQLNQHGMTTSKTKKNFFRHLAQTSLKPLALEIVSAEGIYLTDSQGKTYIDLVSGISVSSTGHRHARVVAAIEKQIGRYLHLMVYGEYIQEPQVLLASRMAEILPPQLSSFYFVNSGSEAVEGALKLAKRYTGRFEVIAFKNAYHGSSHGSLSVTGNENLKIRYRPLLPSIKHLEFNNMNGLSEVSTKTACVIIEPVQGEAGVIPASAEFITALRKKCDETGCLLIFDEIQTGMGRTGKMFGFEHYGTVPEILLLAKAFGGGMPLGAFIASTEIMQCLAHDPALGHISTFGGHPVSCAAALANLEVIIDENLVSGVHNKSELFINQLEGLPGIQEIRSAGLMIAVQFKDEQTNFKVIDKILGQGIISDWFLFNTSAMRIAPPLTISHQEIQLAAGIIRKAIIESLA